MCLVSAGLAGRAEPFDDDALLDVIKQAVVLSRGRGLPAEDSDEKRTRLLSGFRWVRVDEYLDVGPEQFALIAAIAGRTLQRRRREPRSARGRRRPERLRLQDASVQFSQRFERD